MRTSKLFFVPIILSSSFIFTGLTAQANEAEDAQAPAADETHNESDQSPQKQTVPENTQKPAPAGNTAAMDNEQDTYEETNTASDVQEKELPVDEQDDAEVKHQKEPVESTEEVTDEVTPVEQDGNADPQPSSEQNTAPGGTDTPENTGDGSENTSEETKNKNDQDKTEPQEKPSPDISIEEAPPVEESEAEAHQQPETPLTEPETDTEPPTENDSEHPNYDGEASAPQTEETGTEDEAGEAESASSEEERLPEAEADQSETGAGSEGDKETASKTAEEKADVAENEEMAANEGENTSKEDADVSVDNKSDSEKDEKKSEEKEDPKDEDRSKKESEDEIVKAESELQLNSNQSVQLFSLNLSADSNQPSVTDAQYAARFADGENSGLYSPVTSADSHSLDFLEDTTVYISKKAEYDGTTYYRIHKNMNGAMQGWVKAEDLRLFRLTDQTNHTRDYAVDRPNEHLLTNPWGTEKQTVKRLDEYDTSLFRAEEKLELGMLTFYYGQIDEDYGWLADTRLKTASSPEVSSIRKAARIETNENEGLYSPVTSRKTHDFGSLQDKTVYISQKADYNGTVFYRIHADMDGAMQGWVEEKDMRLFQLSQPESHKNNYSVARPDEYLLTNPWGTSSQQARQLSEYGNSVFQAEEKVKLGLLTFYYGKIGNDFGWLEESRVKPEVPVVTSERYAARVSSNNNSGIYSPVTSETGKDMGRISNQTLFISQKATYNGDTFYRVHSNMGGAMQGWIKNGDLDLYMLTAPKTHDKKYSVARENDYLLTNPWGTSSQRVNRLSSYGDSVFQAEKSLQLGLLTFHYGKIGNDYGWIQDNRLTDYTPAPSAPSVETVEYDQSFNQVLDTQMNLNAPPQAWASGGGWRNATRSEVARFLDTSHQTSDTWMYTFLDLDKPQDISSAKINSRLLSGKGTLHNQGTAFRDAARTHGVNEVYLISHALHETGNGTSTLAQGVRLDSNGNYSSNGKLYYNMYGIGAYDNSAVLSGARYAQQMGWDTPAKAIVGGADFISSGYFNRGQTTLYSMRWNPASPGSYQYATDVNWAYATAQNLRNYYRQLGIQGRYYTKHVF
ncbi:GW dipeptide domain-containing protein [Salinicoccus albus]|uniref:GW dipeptide domain-containing protein n=1 Tax=Salinicoccus albus TaxID=418756 RepID=UPI000378E845|nr:GW dipeptide domain-containing protein [Salinicoccus albus]